MSDLAQAVRDAIEALKTPVPREIIAEQLQRALDAAPTHDRKTEDAPLTRLKVLSDMLQDPANKRSEYAASLLSQVREELPKILEDIRTTAPSREPDAREAVADEDPQVIEVARAIAEQGFGRPWDDFLPLNAHDTDQGDLIEYARAAVAALRQPAAPGAEPVTWPEASAEELTKFIAIYDKYMAKYVATNLLHHFTIVPKTELAKTTLPPATPPSDERARAVEGPAETWAYIERLLHDECGLMLDCGLDGQRANCINAIKNGLPDPALISAAIEFLNSGEGLHKIRVNGRMMDRKAVALALTPPTESELRQARENLLGSEGMLLSADAAAAFSEKVGIGGGDDPIASLIASHEALAAECTRLRSELEQARGMVERAAKCVEAWRHEATNHIVATDDDDCHKGSEEWCLHRESYRIYKRCVDDLRLAIASTKLPGAGQ